MLKYRYTGPKGKFIAVHIDLKIVLLGMLLPVFDNKNDCRVALLTNDLSYDDPILTAKCLLLHIGRMGCLLD